MFFVNFGHPKDAWPQLRGFWGFSRRPGLMDAAFSNRRAKVPNRRINYLFEPCRGRRFLRTAARTDATGIITAAGSGTEPARVIKFLSLMAG
jgi:hypothetical protein